jgi:hypothetical protein
MTAKGVQMIRRDEDVLYLNWEGPFSIKDPEFYSQSLPGLYLFTVPFNGEYHVQYIGKSSMSISARLVGYGSTTGHLRDTVSGRYYLYDPAERRNLRLVTKYKLQDNFAEFFMNLEEYQRIARENLEDTAFFFCPFQVHDDLIDIAESTLIYHVLSTPDLDKNFPIIENSKRISSAAYDSGLSLNNTFPNKAKVIGFETLIPAPTRS